MGCVADHHRSELVRYVVNGIVATAVHFLALSVLLEFCHFESAGLANVLAATLGICVSFLGNRYFVFPHAQGGAGRQAVRFVVLYAAIAALHGLVLMMWSDISGLDYRSGFVVATFLQFILSYAGNKWLVFGR